jgi:methylglutaconyl-CoA hydratase
MIQYRNDGQVARITFDRAEPGNKLTLRMVQDLIASLEDATASGAALLVLDSAQTDFTSGRDQTEKVDLPRLENLSLILKANKLLRNFQGISVSLIRGRALGFGSGLAAHSTVAIAEDSARFGFDEIKHGLAPLIVVAYLPYFIPAKLARELCLTGREISAADALAAGLINRIVPVGGLEAALDEVRQSTASFHPGALKLIRSFSERSTPYPSDAILEAGARELAAWIEAGKPLDLPAAASSR